MARKIKGITIEINGETTKLQSALKQVDSSLTNTQKNLKDVRRLLKFDPKNTELLAQKQKMLKDAISDTEDKLKTLKEADKQAKEQLKNGDLGQDQYDALQREIAETESYLKNLKKEADTVGDTLKNFGGKISRVGEGISSAGEKMMPISAGTAAVGVAVGKMAADFDDSMAEINTLLDDDTNLKGYEASIKSLSNETGKPLSDMADGMYQAISSLGDGGKETEGIFKIMAKSAKAGGAETSDSVSLISAGMKGFGKVNEETAKKISDLAFQTAKLGVTTFPEMAKSMQPLFPLASSLNLSYEDLFGSMATLTGVTGNTAEVSTQLKAVFSNLMKPTKDMSALIEKYGYSSGAAMIENEGFAGTLKILKDETGGQSDKLAALFSSTEALTAMTALTGDQFDTFGEKMESMGSCAGATETAYEKLETSGDKVRVSINKIKNAGIELGGALMELLAPIIDEIAGKVEQLTQWFSGLDDSQKETIVKIGLLVAALGPALLIIGKVVSGIGGITSLIGGLISGLSGASGGFALLSGSALPVIGIIAGLVAAGVALYQNWDQITVMAGEKWPQIQTTIGTIIDTVQGIISGFIGLVSAIWDRWGQDIVSVVSGAFAFILTQIQGALAFIQEIINVVTAVINGDWSGAWEGIKNIASMVWENIKHIVSTYINAVKNTVSNILDAIKGFFKTKFNEAKESVRSAIDGIKNKVTSGLDGAKTAATNKLNAIKTKFKSVFDEARETVKRAIDKIKGFFDFEWKLPKLKLPHFNITGEFSLNPPSIPTFDVKWYKKAMDEVHVLNGASIFGNMGGQLLGGGEAGSEMIVGTQHMLGLIQKATEMNNISLISALNVNTTRVINMMQHYFPLFASMKMVLDTGTVVGALAPAVDRELGKISEHKGRGN